MRRHQAARAMAARSTPDPLGALLAVRVHPHDHDPKDYLMSTRTFADAVGPETVDQLREVVGKPRHAFATRGCKSCGARIVWTTTATGASMPVDADPVDDGNVVVRRTPGGQVTSEVLPASSIAAPPTVGEGGMRTVSHFTTCPHAAEHRKARR